MPGFSSNSKHMQFADQVFKKDIDVIYSNRYVGCWETLNYEVLFK